MIYGARPLLAGLLLTGGASVASAVTVDYYYVGGPAFLSNAPDQPLFNTGHLRIDTDRLAPGTALENLEVRFQAGPDAGPDSTLNAEAVVEYDFALGTGETDLPARYSLSFDADGALTAWNFQADYAISTSVFELFEVGGGRDLYYFEDASGFRDDAIREAVLAASGYAPGSDAYEGLACGSWASGDGTCYREGSSGSPGIWQTILRSEGGGTWIRDDAGRYAALVAERTAAGLAQPPGSFRTYDPADYVAAIPLPAPLALLAGGIGALALVGAGRKRRAA
ncbi:MAG: hypothetical protein KDK03_13425 [Rhodobacteraceae bacterium]|nr:hypothetical protein [Paracoccaceae bacterium]